MRIVHYYRQFNQRIRLLYFVIGILFSILSIGLFWRQIVLQSEYKKKENRQSLRRIIQPAPRGNILDRNGNILVGNRPRFSAVVSLHELREKFRQEYYFRLNEIRKAHELSQPNEPFHFDWEKLQWESRRSVLQHYLNQINQILDTDKNLSIKDIKAHFWYRLLMPFPLMSDLSSEQYAQLIEQLPFGSKIFIYTDTTREYPYNQAAAHVLGYVVANREVSDSGLPGNKLKTFSYKGKIGKNGLEKQFDQQLQGKSGGEIWIVDRFQYQYELLEKKNAQQGQDLITSLDINLQLAAERALENKTGAVVVIDVESGEILTMASNPGYNLNELSPSISQIIFDDINERGAWLNRATQGLYPPASPFKIIASIAAMKKGKITPYTKLKCNAFFKVGRRLFPEHGGHCYGMVDLPKALEKSSNVYFYQIGINTGIEAISQQAIDFGLAEPTGVELPYETRRMLVPNKEWKYKNRGLRWSAGDTANVAIGQGDLLVTPLQMAAFTASLARRETRTKVSLLHNSKNYHKDHGGQPIGLTEQQYQAIWEGMSRVVGPGGTAKKVKIDGLNVAGKTGTGQIKAKGKRLTLAWFIGFAPVEKPQIAIAVVVEGKQKSDNYSGGKTAGPIAKSIFEVYKKNIQVDISRS